MRIISLWKHYSNQFMITGQKIHEDVLTISRTGPHIRPMYFPLVCTAGAINLVVFLFFGTLFCTSFVQKSSNLD